MTRFPSDGYDSGGPASGMDSSMGEDTWKLRRDWIAPDSSPDARERWDVQNPPSESFPPQNAIRYALNDELMLQPGKIWGDAPGQGSSNSDSKPSAQSQSPDICVAAMPPGIDIPERNSITSYSGHPWEAPGSTSAAFLNDAGRSTGHTTNCTASDGYMPLGETYDTSASLSDAESDGDVTDYLMDGIGTVPREIFRARKYPVGDNTAKDERMQLTESDDGDDGDDGEYEDDDDGGGGGEDEDDDNEDHEHDVYDNCAGDESEDSEDAMDNLHGVDPSVNASQWNDVHVLPSLFASTSTGISLPRSTIPAPAPVSVQDPNQGHAATSTPCSNPPLEVPIPLSCPASLFYPQREQEWIPVPELTMTLPQLNGLHIRWLFRRCHHL
ncbi:hypothetical protein BV20DRAFT_1054670 [Pilatotrama ljubarskyi]|nr:hypothetical protein BV20DRAFT_1054670 [Pilatotrama ljubarskyi]